MAGGLGMDKCREEFEEWLFSYYDDEIARNLCERTKQALYDCYQDAWQASRAALVVELPSVSWADNLGQECMLLDEVTRMLDKAGIKYE